MAEMANVVGQVDLRESVSDSPTGRAKLDACSERVTDMLRIVSVTHFSRTRTTFHRGDESKTTL
jgi:hypothetical protein